MISVKSAVKKIVVSPLVLLFLAGSGISPSQWPGVSAMAASGAGVSGIVKDDAGKALRGARITVASERESVSRFSDQSGRFRIDDIKPGGYEITASAWGYEQKQESRELTGELALDFELAPHWNVDRLSTADWLSALPENEETLTLRATCIRCHNLSYISRRRGVGKQQWASIVQFMAKGGTMGDSFSPSFYTPEQSARIAPILEKYFGPASPLPTREQVEPARDRLDDAVLRATFREYKPLTQMHIHSIQPDTQGKYVWFSYFAFGGAVPAAKLGRFEIATGEMQDFQPPIDGTFGPITVSRDGDVWFTGNDSLFTLDAKTGEYSRFTPPAEIRTRYGRTMPQGEDSKGNIWTAGRTIVMFDTKTREFQEFEIPKVPLPLKDHEKNLGNTVTEGQTEAWSHAYALAVDSKDNIWYSAYDVGHIAMLNPKTSETKMYRAPDAVMIKGIAVGPDDTVWFASFERGTLTRLDPGTGQMKQYRSPTRFAEFYTPVVCSDGNVWLSDFTGSHMTRFNPKTEEFTEYPLPATDGMVRFFGLDPQERVWYVDFETGIIGVLDPGDA